jgi:transcriptional regulator with PAS, ATPase and Fis domain
VRDTIDQSWSFRHGRQGSPDPVPGLLMVFSDERAAMIALPLVDGAITLGRGDVGGITLDDGRMSRNHAEARFDGKRWHICDLGSRNGTFVDGQQLAAPLVSDSARILRVGGSLFGLLSDVRRFQRALVENRDGVVVGPTLRQKWDEIERAARSGDALHLTGESGSGKELAARWFHRSGNGGAGPFVAVNCAAIPPNLAERLLFGAKKGAYSGADSDADGYLTTAHGGTLFLDEIAELDLGVQAKLLRVLETREVLALGAAKPRKVDLAVCSATHQDLRAQSTSGKFRQDLYFRIARPHVVLPPLRDRLEDIPWIIERELKTLKAHGSLVEACLLRSWPGNVRELVVEIRHADAEAQKAASAFVTSKHLSADAGMSMEEAPEKPELTPSQILEALRSQNNNVTRAAKVLGWHRNQLRRWLARNGDPHLPKKT